MLIAHRGLYNENIRENTISAFDNAFKNGYDGIEIDVRLTKDNIPVVIHDSFISRVSNGQGRIKDYTYKELLNFNFGITKDEKIPTLEKVINRYKNKIIIIELKEKIDIVKYLNNNNKYYISSFNYDYIKSITKIINYNLGVINYVFNFFIDYNKLDFIMILDALASDTLIKKFKDKNIEVIIYGVVGKINKYNSNIKYII